MPKQEGPYFYQKKEGLEFVSEPRQSRNVRGKYSKIYIEEDEFDRHSPEKYAQLLTEGPCLIRFRRVTYGAGGVREIKCIKPTPLPRNAFDPRYPTLIAVIDLDIGKWRSFYYEQVQFIKRVLPKDLTYEQRKLALRATNQNYDKLFPGDEAATLKQDDVEEEFEYSPGVKYPAVLTNKTIKNKEINNDARQRQETLREALKRKDEQLRLAREQRLRTEATDRNNTAQPPEQ